MGTEQFVELLWRIHSKPGIIPTSAGRNQQGLFLKHDEISKAQSVYVYTFPSPTVAELGETTLLETLG